MEPSVVVVEKEYLSPPDCRPGRRATYNGCICPWNASIPYMEANDSITIHENATGEIPTVLKADVLYRVVKDATPPSREIILNDRQWSNFSSLIHPVIRDVPNYGEIEDSLTKAIRPDVSYAKVIRTELYKAAKISLDPEVMSRIGTLAQQIIAGESEREFVFSITREFNRPASFFCNPGSCYFEARGSYRHSLCSCKQSGVSFMLILTKETKANTLRELVDNYYPYVAARALVMPLVYVPKGNLGNATKGYHLTSSWDKERITRFLVTNCYLSDEGKRMTSLFCAPNLEKLMASLLAFSLKGGISGENAKAGSYDSHRFYMNDFRSGRNLSIVHVGREVPKVRIPVTLLNSFVYPCAGRQY